MELIPEWFMVSRRKFPIQYSIKKSERRENMRAILLMSFLLLTLGHHAAVRSIFSPRGPAGINKAETGLPTSSGSDNPGSNSRASYRSIENNSTNFKWVAAYIGSWEIAYNGYAYVPIYKINFSAYNVIFYFSANPDTSNDSLFNRNKNSWNPATFDSLTTYAHRAGSHVSVCIGGNNSEAQFLYMTANRTRLDSFMTKVRNFVRANNLDGVDIDWEPFPPADTIQFKLLMETLRSYLPQPYLVSATAASGWPYGVFGSIAPYVDRVNIMTYDMLQFASEGWATWYFSPIHSGSELNSIGKHFPSLSSEVDSFYVHGLPYSKMNVADEFGGALWSQGRNTMMVDKFGNPTGNGPLGPYQKWAASEVTLNYAPRVTPDIPWYNQSGTGVFQKYYHWHNSTVYHYDSVHQASYLSYDSAGATSDFFMPFVDTTDIVHTFQFAQSRGLGGIFFYELGQAYSEANGGSITAQPFIIADRDTVFRQFSNKAPDRN